MVPPPVGALAIPPGPQARGDVPLTPIPNLCLTFCGARMAWEKLGQLLRLFPSWEYLSLWVYPNDREPQRGHSKPCVVTGSGHGPWQTWCGWMSLSWTFHPPITNSLCAAPFSQHGRNSLLVGIPSFLARGACAGTVWSPVMSREPQVEGQLPRACLGGHRVPEDLLPPPGESRPGQRDPLPGEAPQGFAGPWGGLCSPRRLARAHTCPWLVREMKPP